MSAAKLTNYVAGLLLMLCGVMACFFPIIVGDYYGMKLEQAQAITTLRVVGGFFISVGWLFIIFARKNAHNKELLFSLLVIMIGFAASRILGLIIDGVQQSSMLYELYFELFCIVFVAYVYFLENRNATLNDKYIDK